MSLDGKNNDVAAKVRPVIFDPWDILGGEDHHFPVCFRTVNVHFGDNRIQRQQLGWAWHVGTSLLKSSSRVLEGPLVTGSTFTGSDCSGDALRSYIFGWFLDVVAT